MRQFREKVKEQFDNEYRYSPYIKKMLWLLVIASLLFWSMRWMSNNRLEPTEFYPAADNHSTGYSSLKIELLSWPVAHERNYSYYVVADEEYYVYLVRMTEEQFQNLKEVYDYTFGEGEIEPVRKTIVGMPVKIPDKLYEVSYEGFQVFTDKQMDLEEYKEYVGAYYLDCADYPYRDLIYGCMVGIVICFSLTVYFFILYMKKSRLHQCMAQTLTAFDITEAESELAVAKDYRSLSILLLQNYVVEAEGKLLLLPLCEITKLVVSNLFGRGKQLTVWTKEGQRIVLCKTRSRKGEVALLELSQILYERNPEMEAILWQEPPFEPEEEAFAEIKCENE